MTSHLPKRGGFNSQNPSWLRHCNEGWRFELRSFNKSGREIDHFDHDEDQALVTMTIGLLYPLLYFREYHRNKKIYFALLTF